MSTEPQSNRLYVGNIPWSTTVEELQGLFTDAENIEIPTVRYLFIYLFFSLSRSFFRLFFLPRENHFSSSFFFFFSLSLSSDETRETREDIREKRRRRKRRRRVKHFSLLSLSHERKGERERGTRGPGGFDEENRDSFLGPFSLSCSDFFFWFVCLRGGEGSLSSFLFSLSKARARARFCISSLVSFLGRRTFAERSLPLSLSLSLFSMLVLEEN
jgi:hypothetical protein